MPYSKSGSIIRISYNFDGSNVNLIMNSVSIAYFLGPLLGGEISQYIGFSWLMSVIGLANIFYAFYLIRTVLRPTVYTNDFFFLVFEEKVSILNIHFSFVTHTHRVTPKLTHRKRIISSSCVCGRPTQPYQAIRAIKGFMIQWIRRSNRFKNQNEFQ